MHPECLQRSTTAALSRLQLSAIRGRCINVSTVSFRPTSTVAVLPLSHAGHSQTRNLLPGPYSLTLNLPGAVRAAPLTALTLILQAI